MEFPVLWENRSYFLHKNGLFAHISIMIHYSIILHSEFFVNSSGAKKPLSFSQKNRFPITFFAYSDEKAPDTARELYKAYNYAIFDAQDSIPNSAFILSSRSTDSSMRCSDISPFSTAEITASIVDA